MEAALGYFELLVLVLAFDAVHKAIFATDPARPTALQRPLQGLRLPSSLERGPNAFLNQVVDPFENVFVVLKPILVFFPRLS